MSASITVRGTAWYSLATRGLVLGVELVVVWGEWCTVTVTVTVSTTAPIRKKQKRVGIKYLVKILWSSSLILLVQCSLAFSLYAT